jgi:hypothetical protein
MRTQREHERAAERDKRRGKKREREEGRGSDITYIQAVIGLRMCVSTMGYGADVG